MALQDSWDLQSRATDVDFPEDLLVPAKPWPSSMIYQLKNGEQKWFIYLWKIAKNCDLAMESGGLPIKKGWFTYE